MTTDHNYHDNNEYSYFKRKNMIKVLVQNSFLINIFDMCGTKNGSVERQTGQSSMLLLVWESFIGVTSNKAIP